MVLKYPNTDHNRISDVVKIPIHLGKWSENASVDAAQEKYQPNYVPMSKIEAVAIPHSETIPGKKWRSFSKLRRWEFLDWINSTCQPHPHLVTGRNDVGATSVVFKLMLDSVVLNILASERPKKFPMTGLFSELVNLLEYEYRILRCSSCV